MKTEKEVKEVEVHEAQVVSVLDNLKTSNLPEIIGWKEKQEKLVEENPYLEIIDTKTYEDACKRRTALLKGRTELQNQDKSIASKLAIFRKEVGSETATLIAITQPHEEKQDVEVKRWEGIKAAEKKAKEEAEANRVKSIQDKLESIETESYKIIQSMVFSEIQIKTTEVNSICSPGFDFEEYDVLYDQVVSRVETALESKVKTLTDQENQRLENIRLEQENAKAKRIADLQASRLTEIMPYVAFGTGLDLTKLGEMDDTEYSGHLSSKKGLFEADAKIKAKAEEERLAKEQEEKDAIFEIRKKRLEDFGFVHVDTSGTAGFLLTGTKLEYQNTDVYHATPIEFEEIFSVGKEALKRAEAEYLKARFETRKEYLLAIGFSNKLDNGDFMLDGIATVSHDNVYDPSDEIFDEYLLSVKNAVEEKRKLQEKADKEASEAEAKRMKAENKARIKQYSKDKKFLTEFVGSLDFRNAVPELENQDLEVVVSEFMEVVAKWKAEAVELISKY